MYLLLFFLVYFLVVFVLRSYLLWIKTGVNPLTFNKDDDAHGYNGKVFSFISVLELIVISIYAFSDNWRDFLLPLWYLEYPISQKIGCMMLLLSLVIVWVAQSQMADSWRIGIDEENKTELVTNGLFRYSRNPIFLGIMVANIGLFSVLPNAFTMLIVALSTISVNTQIRLEEEYLKKTHKNFYLDYSKKVRRWI
jgi:protein-S-isoprenylcysteine O-methyltransferase Ste14